MSIGLATVVALDRERPAQDDLVAQHLDWLRLRSLRENTVRARESCLGRLRRFVGVPLARVTSSVLDEWQRDMLPRLSAAGRQHEISHVRQFYKWAANSDLIPRDPAFVLVRPRTPRRVPRPISERDLARAIDGAPRRVRTWLVLAAYAGLRACEIARLEREHVLDEDDPPALLVADGKGGNQRIVPLNSLVLTELQRYGMPTGGPLFLRGDGLAGHVTPNRLSQLVNRYLRSQDIAAVLHQGRHRYATNAYRITQDLRVVQELLGHASPSTTALYAGHSTTKGHQAVEQMGGGTTAVTTTGAATTVVGRTLSEDELLAMLEALRMREQQLSDREAALEKAQRQLAESRAAERSTRPRTRLPDGALPDHRLTDRERQILLLIADGLTNAEIGRQLALSPLTVKSHLARISRKVGVGNRAKLAAWVVRDAALYDEMRSKALAAVSAAVLGTAR